MKRQKPPAPKPVRACPTCWGDGFYFVVPEGFNPFYAGAWATARVATRRVCWACGGDGRVRIVPEGR